MIDKEGKIAFPARVLSRRGLRPGNKLLLV